MRTASLDAFPTPIEQLNLRRVVIVDDDCDLADATADALRDIGYAATTADDGDSAIERAGQFAADVAVIDLRLGMEDGVDLIAELRKVRPNIQCILVTGHADTSSAVRALRNGASEYLYKPVEINMLDAVLNRCFDRLRLEAEKDAAERALRESEERFRAFFENTPVNMSLKDTDGRHLMVNESHADWLGKSVDNVVGKYTAELLQDQNRFHAMAAMEQSVIESGDSIQEEIRVRKEDGSTHDRILIKFPVKSDEGTISAIGTVAIDITEQKRAERKLAESETLLRNFIDNSNATMNLKDLNGRYLLVNEAFKKKRGDGDYIGKTYQQSESTADVAKILAADRRVIDTGEVVHGEGYVEYENGTSWYRRYTKFPVLDADGTLIGIGSIGSDESEQVRTEEALRASEARYRDLTEGSVQGILLHRDFKPIYVNQAWAVMFGYDSPDEILAMESIAPLFATGEVARLTMHQTAHTEGGEAPNRHEFQGIRKDGSRIWLDNTARTIMWDNKETIQATVVDITERKVAENAKRETEAHLRAIIDNYPSLISLKDLEGRFLLVNDAFAKLRRVSVEECIGVTPEQLETPEHAAVVKEHDLAALEGGAPITYERVWVNKFGESYPVAITKFPTYDADGKLMGIGTIGIDITERKRAQDALRESEALLRSVIDSSPTPISLKGLDHKLLVVNQAFEEVFQLTSGQLIGHVVTEFLHNEHAERVHALDRQVIETGKKQSEERSLTLPNGNIMESIVTRFPIANEQGKVTLLGTIVTDISDRKKAEDALRESESLLRSIIDSSPSPITLKDLDHNFVVVNKAFEKITGVPADQVIGRTSSVYMTPKLTKVAELQENRVIETGKTSSKERVATLRNGTQVQSVATKFPIVNADGEITLIGTIMTDISNLRKAEEAKRNSEAQLRAIVDNYHSRITLKDTDGRYLLVNEAFAKSRNLSVRDLIGKMPDDIESAHQAAVVKDHDKDAMEHGGVVTHQRDWKAKDGTFHPREVTKFPAYDTDGRLMGIGSISTDISERKRMEDALRESEALLRSVIDSSPTPISLKGLDHKLLVVNRAYEKMHGQPAATLVGKSAVEYMAPEHAQATREMERRVVTEGRTISEERIASLPDGTQIQCIVTKFPVRNTGGAISLVGTIMTDIANRKKMEAALRESEQQLRLVIDSLPVLITYVNANEQYVLANKTGAEWYATTPEAFVGKSPMELQGDSYEKYRAQIKETLKGNKVTFEANVSFPDGTTRDVEITNVPDIAEDGAVRGFFGMTHDVSERKHAERLVKESEARFRAVVDNSPAAIYLKDIEGHYLIANKTFREWLNVDSDEDWLGKTIDDFFPSDKIRISKTHDQQVVAQREPVVEERELIFPDGVTRRTLNHKFPILGPGGECIAIGTVNMDVTDQYDLQSQLVQAQKMEAVGQLTGGVAHDFNNLLGVIIGNLDFLSEELRENEELTALLEPAMKAALSGATLNKQLLAFSRKQALSPKVVDLNQHIAGVLDMLHRTLGETVEIRANLDSSMPTTKVDPAQLESVLLNLAVNARDAMPDGGTLSIETDKVHLDEDYVAMRPEVSPGDYVVLAVTDTGTGMSPEIQVQAFDPFFTTKRVGEGSGLGLSMVFGFTKQSGGHVEIKSDVGKGTMVKVFLPQVEKSEQDDPLEEPSTPKAKGESILVVEDDPGMLELVTNYLGNLGYIVSAAESGKAALEILEQVGTIDLLLTDVVMPGGISGPALAESVKERRPNIKVIFMSGYTANKLNPSVQRDGDATLLLKPFRNMDLAKTLRKTLDD